MREAADNTSRKGGAKSLFQRCEKRRTWWGAMCERTTLCKVRRETADITSKKGKRYLKKGNKIFERNGWSLGGKGTPNLHCTDLDEFLLSWDSNSGEEEEKDEVNKDSVEHTKEKAAAENSTAKEWAVCARENTFSWIPPPNWERPRSSALQPALPGLLLHSLSSQP